MTFLIKKKVTAELLFNQPFQRTEKQAVQCCSNTGGIKEASISGCHFHEIICYLQGAKSWRDKLEI